MALAACGTRASVEPLFSALSDADPLVAQAASIALENLTGHAETFDAFAPSNARHAAGEGLAGLVPRHHVGCH